MVRIKRAYEPSVRSDGHRVLVERLWPRGVRKDDAHLDGWLKEIAPSDALRRWYGHDPARFPEFRRRYEQELRSADAKEILDELVQRAAREPVTLIYAAHDEEHNSAVVLAGVIERRLRAASSAGARSTRAAHAHRHQS